MLMFVIFIVCLIAGLSLSKAIFEELDGMGIFGGVGITLMLFVITIFILGEKEKWNEGYYMYYKGEVVVCKDFKVKWSGEKSTPVLINGEEVSCQKRSPKRVLDEKGVIHD